MTLAYRVQLISLTCSLLTGEITEILALPQDGILLIITAGNALRSDDGVGPYIFQRLLPKNKKTVVLNAGDRLESIIDRAVETCPAKTVIIDAADFSGTPGEIRIIPEGLIPESTLSTHSFPLVILSKILSEDTNSPVYFIGIQAKNMQLGEGLSDEVKAAADTLINYLNI